MRITLEYTITALFIRDQGVSINRSVFMVSPEHITLFQFFNKISLPIQDYLGFILFSCFFFLRSRFPFAVLKKKRLNIANEQTTNKQKKPTHTHSKYTRRKTKTKQTRTHIHINSSTIVE
jgi:hypothetical protein